MFSTGGSQLIRRIANPRDEHPITYLVQQVGVVTEESFDHFRGGTALGKDRSPLETGANSWLTLA